MITLNEIIEKSKRRGRGTIVISYAEELKVLEAAKRAKEEGLGELLIVGERETVPSCLQQVGIDPREVEIFEVSDLMEQRRKALELVRSEEADLFVDGKLIDRGLVQILQEEGFFRRKLLSYVSLFEGDGKLIMFTDTYMNSYPNVGEKIVILENAIELVQILGVEEPKVAVLSAIEVVNPSMRSTLDAAVLSKMGERGQFGRVLVEGPLAMDNATSAEAARIKGIANPVSGNADIYLLPDGETGFLLTQLLRLYGKRRMAGALMGTGVPIVPLLEWDDAESLFFSIALALLRS
ncbi:MAG: phosphate butyryltransferase [Deltaproteobacteria bacterium]|nr:MAG: phosphate butyryltransferase [Deltaproteobacteria bacterium]